MDPRPPLALVAPVVLATALAASIPGVAAADADDPASPEFFRTRIEPVLRESCFRCHRTEGRQRGGVVLDTADGTRDGGPSGPGVVPGDPDASWLVRAIRYDDPVLEMPPDGKLPASVIADIEAWVKAGAHDPRVAEAAAPPARERARRDRRRRGGADDPLGTLRPGDAMVGGDDPPMLMGGSGAMTGDGVLDEAPALSREDLRYFESKVRPVLIEHCYACHASDGERIRGGLTLDTREGIRRGGHSGPAVVPGDVDSSLLIRAIRFHDDELAMPPDGRLPDAVITDLERWVAMGAPDPRDATAEQLAADGVAWEDAKDHWAFRPPARPEVPEVDDARWPLTDVDRFVLAQLEERGLEPVRDADKVHLVRRLSFDLTGLPPSPELVESFVRDRADDAYETLVDELLASRAFGERWGRHWLDVARYGESSGKENNVLYPHAWRYRDWVLDAFDEDLPYDELLRMQIAGDLMPTADPTARAERMIATGYLALGPKSHNARNPVQFALDVADEQIDAIGQGMLGLTVSCARCHDHKFDPIPTADYYAMAGILTSTETLYGTRRIPGNNRPSDLLPLPAAADVPDGGELPPLVRTFLSRQRDRLGEQVERLEAQATRARESGDRNSQAAQRLRNVRQQIALVDDVLGRVDASGRATEANRVAMGVRERRVVRDIPILVRGELDQRGPRVPRGVPTLIAHPPAPDIPARSSGRLELAAWITDPEHPLTARVWVNRVWQHLFGEGLVSTPNNFGLGGQPPSHPLLLDHLATWFTDHGWSTKALVKELVMSRTYRLSTRYDRSNAEVDPGNRWRWRMSPRRLDAEAIRDAMLLASGTLDLAPPVGTPVSMLEGAARLVDRFPGDVMDPPVRSVYLPLLRDGLPEALDVFDGAEPSFVTGTREVTNVPSQALFMLNADSVARYAEAMADRLLAMPVEDDERAREAFRLTLGRAPTASEMRAVKAFFADFGAAQVSEPIRREVRGDRPRDRIQERIRRGRRGGRQAAEATPTRAVLRREAWAAFCQSLFASAEFRYLD